MKRIFVTLGLLVMSVFAAPVNAYTVVEKDMGYVAVNTTASKEITPDTASIYFSVETTSNDSKVAISKNKEISSNLINSLKPILALEKSDSIQTKDFILRPNYNYDKNGKKTFVNYSAINVIFVKTKKLESIGTLIDTVVANNATTVNDLNFYVENQKHVESELAQEAIANAKILAKLTATTLNQKVNGVKSIRVNIYPEGQYSPRFSAMAASDMVNKKTTPIEFGKIKLQANVSAEFYVK